MGNIETLKQIGLEGYFEYLEYLEKFINKDSIIKFKVNKKFKVNSVILDIEDYLGNKILISLGIE